MGARLSRAAQRQRTEQEGRRPAERAGAHREHLRPSGFDSIDKSDLRGRFRWWGLYTQREQGYDGTWTGDENIEIHRGEVLHDAGALRRRRADRRAAAHARCRSPPSSPATPPTSPTARTCSTTGSASRTCPRSGGAWRPSACRPPRRAATARAWCSARRWPASRSTRSSTPRRRSTRSCGATSASRSTPTSRASTRPRSPACRTSCHEVNDIAFIGVNHPEHGPGLDLWVGGGLSTNPMLGQRLGAWVPLDEVPDVWEAITSAFRDYGYRRLRSKARLKFLIKDWGVEKFRRGRRDRVPEASADRRAGARAGGAPDRPRRRAAAEERPQRGRGGPDRRPGVGHDPVEGRRHRRERPAPTGSGSRRTRS